MSAEDRAAWLGDLRAWAEGLPADDPRRPAVGAALGGLLSATDRRTAERAIVDLSAHLPGRLILWDWRNARPQPPPSEPPEVPGREWWNQCG